METNIISNHNDVDDRDIAQRLKCKYNKRRANAQISHIDGDSLVYWRRTAHRLDYRRFPTPVSWHPPNPLARESTAAFLFQLRRAAVLRQRRNRRDHIESRAQETQLQATGAAGAGCGGAPSVFSAKYGSTGPLWNRRCRIVAPHSCCCWGGGPFAALSRSIWGNAGTRIHFITYRLYIGTSRYSAFACC